jgi:hypothetical protein
VIFTLKTERNFNMGLGWAILGAAVVGAGASVYSSSKASKAAKSASNVQAESSDAAIAEQRRQFDAMRELLRPYIEAGNPELTKPFASVGPVALQHIQRLSGLSGESIRQQNLNLAFESAGYKKIASSALSEINDYQSKRDAARKSIKDPISLERFDSETNAVVQAIQDKAFAKQQEFVRPIVENKDYDKINVEQQRQAIQQIEQGPLYQELAKQGEEAILAAASATGRRGSEGTQSALARYRPQLLNQLIEQQYGRLGGLANVGQAAAQNMLNLGQASAAGQAGAGMQSANSIGNLLMAQGGAQAAGIQGAAAAQAAGIGGVANAISGGIQNYALMNALGFGGGGGYESFAGSGDWTMGQGAQSGFMSTNVM